MSPSSDSPDRTPLPIRAMPMVWLAAAILFGLIFSKTIHLPTLVSLILVLLAAVFLAVEIRFLRSLPFFKDWRKFVPIPVGLLLLAFALGMFRFTLTQRTPTPSNLDFYNDQPSAILTARVNSMPEMKSTALQFTVRALQYSSPSGTQSIPVSGQALVRVPKSVVLHYGDLLMLQGQLTTPQSSDTFNYQEYLAQHGIYSVMSYPDFKVLAQRTGSPIMTFIYGMRELAYETLQKVSSGQKAALLSGILLGIDNDVSPSLTRAYQQTGTSHIIAISGFNIAIVAGLLGFLFRKVFIRWQAALLAIGGITFYTLLVGATPSVVRAAIMGSLVILAQLIGRRSAGINILLMTGAIMCLFNPYLPWDLSFQLSFLATLGLVLFAEPLTSGVSAWIEKRISNPALQKTVKGLVAIFLLTIAAQAMTLPVLAYHFRSISLSALLANPLVLPVQPALMVLGLAAVMLGIVWLPLGGIFGWAASLLAGYTNSMVTLLSKIPGTLSLPQISLGVVIAGYALLFVWLWLYPRSPRRLMQGTLVTGLVLASFGVWTTGLRISDDRLHIRILSNPDHPALILQTPQGGWLMLNGLADTMEFQSAVQHFLPSLNRHLDALVITSLDPVTVSSNHDAVADFPVATILWGLEGQGNPETRWLESDLRQLGTSSQMMNTGDTFELDGVTIQAVEISDTARSLLIRYGNFELAIPDGIPAKDLSAIVPSTSTLLLTQAQSLDPDLASWTSDHSLLTISTGAPPFGWKEWKTITPGESIDLITDGNQMWIEPGS